MKLKIKLLTSMIFFCLAAQAQIDPALVQKMMAANQKTQKAEEKSVSHPVVQNENLKSPRATLVFFMKHMELYSKGERDSLNLALEALDLSSYDSTLRKTLGRNFAEKLLFVIDRLVKFDSSSIKDEVESEEYKFLSGVFRSGEQFVDVEMSLRKVDGVNWRFSDSTLKKLDDYAEAVRKWPSLNGVSNQASWKFYLKQKMPDWTGNEFFLMKNGQWLGLIFLAFLSLAAFFVTRLVLTRYLKKKISEDSMNLSLLNEYQQTYPFGILAASLTWLMWVSVLELPITLLAGILRVGYIATALSSVWCSLRIVDIVGMHFEKMAAMSENKFDDVLVPLLKKAAKVLVIAFGAIFVAHSLTIHVGSVLAGLGIGGIAVAFAAKDTIANLFGSMTVILDRPFQIGDLIVLDKGGIEGTVETIGFRSTRIRTPYQSLITVPNSTLANMNIDNYGLRSYRRFRTILQLRYDTPNSKIEIFCDGLRQLILNNPMLRHDNYHVYLHELGAHSINILFNVFIMTDDGKEELAEKHRLISQILDLAARENIQFAFPTQSVVLEKN